MLASAPSNPAVPASALSSSARKLRQFYLKRFKFLEVDHRVIVREPVYLAPLNYELRLRVRHQAASGSRARLVAVSSPICLKRTEQGFVAGLYEL